MTHFSLVKSIRIRGNKALSEESINEIKTSLPWFVLDLQEPGECGVPSPFKTTAVLNGCKKVYGTIRVSRFIDEVKRSPTVHSLELVGCLQIVGTRINNVDFLDDISSFSFVENTCGYETTCDGGRVDDVYLDNLYGCKNIIGNLTLHNLINKDIDVLVANNASFLKHHMLPLAANCRIPPKDNFLLCERIKTLLSKDVVIMIGGERNPSCVLPHLPHQVKKSHTYKYLGSTYSFTLTKLKKVAPFTTAYTYDVEKAPKGKPVEKSKRTIYYFRWDYVRLPVEFDEILQLAMLYKPGKTVCVSDRRKEVFSLIHMLHTFCHTLQENIGFVDALQLHTEKCNGSVLDRDELVYAMAVIMEWAYQTRSVPPELKKAQWVMQVDMSDQRSQACIELAKGIGEVVLTSQS
ncbi:unnamed protein product [Haemonchus placei]|uniref:Recep_L_domain domain-containing protein n=1 Tax=Haemonchus placei TaxID=6290 RepID=A0A158QMX4_HAEPC|nr:unnamed protein product [Haemonchus placei]